MRKEMGNAWFSTLLLDWYDQNKRILPWRETKDAYKIWISEVVLQQTRVEQGRPYYLKFVERFPDVDTLANAQEEEVLKYWQGLGYYSRARNLHAAAKYVSTELGGQMPKDYEGLKALKGVGDYTAADIAALAYGQPHAAVDGNVYRVLSRVFGIATPIDSTKGKKEFTALANTLISDEKPGDFNQALMDLGATVCTPKSAQCDSCPLAAKCYALGSNSQQELPVKEKKTRVRDRYFHYFKITLPNGETIVNQRKGKDIWTGLFDFPMIETEEQQTTDKLLGSAEFKRLADRFFGLKVQETKKSQKHQLSHQTLHATLYVCEAETATLNTNEQKVSQESFEELAIPRLIELLLEK